jgi:hypothetical protein
MISNDWTVWQTLAAALEALVTIIQNDNGYSTTSCLESA